MREEEIPEDDVFLRPYNLCELFERVGWGDMVSESQKRADVKGAWPARFRAEFSTPIAGGRICTALIHDMIFHHKRNEMHQRFNVSVYEETEGILGKSIGPIAVMTAFDRGAMGSIKTIKINNLDFPALSQGAKTENILAVHTLDYLRDVRERIELGEGLAYPYLEKFEEGSVREISNIEETRHRIGCYE